MSNELPDSTHFIAISENSVLQNQTSSACATLDHDKESCLEIVVVISMYLNFSYATELMDV